MVRLRVCCVVALATTFCHYIVLIIAVTTYIYSYDYGVWDRRAALPSDAAAPFTRKARGGGGRSRCHALRRAEYLGGDGPGNVAASGFGVYRA